MPELPEVETIRRDLRKYIVNKKIKSVKIVKNRVVKNKPDKFLSLLVGSSMSEIGRIGKLLIFCINNGYYLGVHLRMTGQLVYWSKKVLAAGGHPFSKENGLIPDKHTHVIIVFEDNSELRFSDIRMFGYMQIMSEKERKKVESKYGIEPLTENFTLDALKNVLQKRKSKIKSILLDQSLIAGIGNIYADESCFVSGIHPGREAKDLSGEELAALHMAIESVLAKSIEKRGTTFSDYVDAKGERGGFAAHLQVYGRSGKVCFQCQSILQATKIAGRTTVFCSRCQK
jgi:formamidopyrimidine-DNA glycosylase